jgi:general stress protein 26
MWRAKPSIESLTKQVPVADLAASVVSLRRLLRGMPWCMVTTRTDHETRSRPMTLQAIDAAGRLMFLIDQRSETVSDVATHPLVSVTFVAPHHDLYVAVAGHAAVGSDPAQVRRLWKWSYRAAHPQRWRDPNLVVLAVAVKEVEYWSASSRVMRLMRTVQALLTRHPRTRMQHGVLIVEANHGP